MQQSLNVERRFGIVWIAASIGAAILFAFYISARQINFIELPKTSAHHLADGTEGLTKQTALHLSKMQKGASVGGFPGFEPPDDDERYKRKVKGEGYNAEDVNDWVKETNNFLRQIANKNPGMTLEEILIQQGLNTDQVHEFLGALRSAHITVSGMEGTGVTSETVMALKSILNTLGVSTWLP